MKNILFYIQGKKKQLLTKNIAVEKDNQIRSKGLDQKNSGVCKYANRNQELFKTSYSFYGYVDYGHNYYFLKVPQNCWVFCPTKNEDNFYISRIITTVGIQRFFPIKFYHDIFRYIYWSCKCQIYNSCSQHLLE